ncbi:response regulator transcription factor [Candidatus Obscuribacterales bacterium]|nr:response regulator transcription factor [Candidatus Obscuribacterales bacterium]
MTKLLLVEDQKDFADAVRDWLVAQDYLVDIANDGPSALHYLRSGEYDLLILDLNLPGVSGIDVARTFRRQGGKAPIIMLTGNKTIDDKELGFDAGADDYLTKPFNMRELSMRVKAQLRRNLSVNDGCLEISNLKIYPDEHRVLKEDTEVPFLPKEFSLLLFFARNPGKVFSAEALIQRVWASDSEASPDTIRSYITRLRNKLGKNGDKNMIVTVHGVGYRFEP